MADAEVYGDLADHFANRRVARLADAENLSQVLSDVQKKLVRSYIGRGGSQVPQHDWQSYRPSAKCNSE
jgi:hypothetical protein